MDASSASFYRELLRLRRELPALATLDKQSLALNLLSEKQVIMLDRWHDDCRILGSAELQPSAEQFPFAGTARPLAEASGFRRDTLVGTRQHPAGNHRQR